MDHRTRWIKDGLGMDKGWRDAKGTWDGWRTEPGGHKTDPGWVDNGNRMESGWMELMGEGWMMEPGGSRMVEGWTWDGQMQYGPRVDGGWSQVDPR